MTEIDFTKTLEFGKRKIKAPLSPELKTELLTELLAKPTEKQGQFRDSIIFVEDGWSEGDKTWIEEWETRNLSYGSLNEPTKQSLEILQNPNLFKKIIREFNKKIEGEEKSKKAVFLSLCSVWVEGSEVPLNSLVSSESSSGKSFVCKNIIKIFPKEIVEYRTKITPEAFTYWKRGEEDWSWDGKICYLEDISQNILDAPTFKVMCSEGSTATIVIKQRAVDIEINGKPVMLVTTARTNPNSEILNRFQIISLDESKEQTKNIVFRQAKQLNGEKYDERIINSLRVLKRKKVFIPFAEKIATFLDKNYDFENLRLRRDFSRLLDLIKCSAALHQFQRKEGGEGFLIATEEDYRIAREVINYIQTQTFRGLTHKLKKAFDCCRELKEFTAKDIHSEFPFVNQKMWYIYLDQLLERGILKTELVKTDEAKQRVTYYKINEDKTFELPEFDFLPEFITNVTIVTKDTNVTNVTNDGEKERTIVNNVTNVLKKSKLEEEEPIETIKRGVEVAKVTKVINSESKPCDSCEELTSNLINNIPICSKCSSKVAPELVQLNKSEENQND